MEEIGSVCSGGRYDNLTGFYMKEKVSGVGASIGIDRLLAALEMLNKEKSILSFTNAIIFSNKNYRDSYKIISYFRKKDIVVEFFPDNKKMTKQYELAEKKGIHWGIYLENTIASNIEETNIKLKNLITREEFSLSLKDSVGKMLGV